MGVLPQGINTNQTYTFNTNMSPTLQTQPSYLGLGNNPATAQQFFNMGSKQGGNWFSNLSNSYSSWAGGESFLGGGISNGALAGAGMGVANMGVNLLAGNNHTKVGDIMQTVGGIASNIPGVGGLIGGAVGVVGGLINAAFGSSINEEFVNQTKSQTNALGSQVFNSNTNADVLNDWQNMTAMSHVRKSEVGSDGWFSSDAEDTTDDLNRKIDEANKRQLFNFDLAVNNADRNTDFRILSNMTAYGGPINSFRKYYGDGGLFGNETVDNIAQFVPILGTAEDAYTFYNNPSWANAGWLALSLGSDVFTGGMAGRAIKALRMANKAADASRTAQKAAKAAWKTSKRGRATGQVSGADNLRAIRALQAANATRQAAIKRANQALGQAATAVGLDQSVNIGSNVAQSYDKGGYLSQAKALIRQNEGWREKPYKDAPKGKNWRSVGYGFNDSGFREKYPEGISKHYEHGITKKQAEEELDYFLNKAEKQLKSIYGKQWNDFTDSQKAAILDTYYQRPASVAKGSRFYKAVTSGEDAGKYLGVAGYDKRNKVRQGVFGGSQDYINLGIETGNTESNPSTLQEVTPFTPVVHDLDLSGITPTKAKALELNLSSPVFDLSMFNKPSTPIVQQQTPAIGTVEDFLASYGDFEENLFAGGGWMDFFNMWNQAQGGNNYFGNNWKPSDGLQRTTSNGNVSDWMGVAGTTINTLANWGKEDPSLGRGGGYSMFGMAAYDIMKAIRNATKSKRESIGQKLAIPIYAQGGHLFDDGGSVGALGYANIANSALKLASNVKRQTELDVDEDTIYRSINRFGQDFDKLVGNVNTNGDLLDLWANNATVTPNLSGRDFRDKSYFDDFLDSYAASWEGFNAGQNFGPWGAAIGAVIGGGSSIIGSIIGRNKADNAADEANEKIERANNRRIHNLIAAAERVDKENDLRILQNMGANGGKLNMGFGLRNPFIMPDGTANPLFRAFGGGLTHGSDWDTGINWVNEGGSHGENPLGGVQMGVDEQGVPNLVEEGEAIWNGDYVFSKRMKVPKKLAQKYGLGGDLTFADAIAKLTKDSEERPLSNIDHATNDHILGEFADTQEELRMAKAQRAMDKEVQLQDDFLTGFQFGLGGHMSPIGIIPDSDNTSIFEKVEQLYADGGGIHIDHSKKGTFKAQASKMGMGVQEAASHILAHKKDYSPEMVKKAVFAHNFAHAFGGSLFEDGGDLFGEPFLYSNRFDLGGDIKKVQDNLRKNGLTNDQIDEWIYTNKPEWRNEYFHNHRLTNNWQGGTDGLKYVRPQAATSNREAENSNRAAASNSQNTKKGAGKTSANRGSIVPFVYDWYRNGSDGIGTPTGFKVGKNGKAYDYTPEYKALVASLGANDIRKWAAEHPDDPSLKSFLAKGNDLSKLTDEQWRIGATDGKYGFMHHVADQISKEKDRVPADFNWEQEAPWLFGDIAAPETAKPNPMAEIARDKSTPTRSVSVTDNGTNFGVVDTPQAITRSGITGDDSTGITRSPFKPKQTWTRYAPMVMSGLMGLKEMLTPADYANADAIMAAAYQAGAPVSVGTEYIGDYRKRDPFDERYLMNIINQRGSATNRNMMNLSGGNRAVAMSGILANDLTTQMALAEAARQAYLANRADDAQVAEFNRGTNQFNATAQNTRNLSLAQLNSGRQNAMLSGIAQGARLRQAIKDQRDAAISANLTNFAQGLGDLGKENGYYNMLGGLNEEGILKYFYGDDWKTKFNNVNV